MEQPYTLDPFTNFTPRQNPPKPKAEAVLAANDPASLSDDELRRLGEMTREELVGIVRACNADSVRVLMLSEEQQGQLVLDTLLVTAVNAADRKEARESAKLWMDRRLGPIVQKQASLVAIAGSGSPSFIDILNAMDGKTCQGLPQIE